MVSGLHTEGVVVALEFSPPSLNYPPTKILYETLDMYFSCGAQLQDADIPRCLKDVVYVHQISRKDPIEKLYYSAKFESVRIYCAASTSIASSDIEPHYWHHIPLVLNFL
jgi:hypothetical protein